MLTTVRPLETPGELLRQVRSQARQHSLERRADMHDDLHGEVHGCMEPGQRGLHQPDTPGAGQPVAERPTLRQVEGRASHSRRKLHVYYCVRPPFMGLCIINAARHGRKLDTMAGDTMAGQDECMDGHT